MMDALKSLSVISNISLNLVLPTFFKKDFIYLFMIYLLMRDRKINAALPQPKIKKGQASETKHTILHNNVFTSGKYYGKTVTHPSQGSQGQVGNLDFYPCQLKMNYP